ncbi:MAG: hypothetical protein EXS55_03770 [Candidatus Magasanikbacteria bacterium]|nr:hypothetical protein [Candidatus Magasanikbacteria bacterium]
MPEEFQGEKRASISIMTHVDGRLFSREEQQEYGQRADELRSKEGPQGVTEEALKAIFDEIADRQQK